jgi:23S rRNA pseudouridine1911/1915/1917 synthase
MITAPADGMATRRTLATDRGDTGRRIDLVVRRHLRDVPAASRTRVQEWIAEGRVFIGNAAVRRPSTRVGAADVVAGDIPAGSTAPQMAPEAMALAILYEDDHLLAVDKPAGVVVHPGYGHRRGTLMHALLWHARSWPAPMRPSLVSRLDRLTSGVLLVAKSAAIHAALQAAHRRSDKDYLAVVHGRVNTARGTIALPLARDTQDRRRMAAGRGVDSLTEFERLARRPAPGPAVSLLRCRLRTGRMHQIRAHLAARGWPIVGDPSYGRHAWPTPPSSPVDAALRAFSRQALHAWRIALPHPVTGARLDIEAPLPADISDLLIATDLAPRWRAEEVG